MNRIVQSTLPLPVSSTDFSRQNSFDFFEVNQELFLKKFTNLVMKNGKKNKASKIMFETFTLLKRKIQSQGEKKQSGTSHESENFFSVFYLLFKALENITPSLHVRKVRVSGSTYLVPAVLSKKKQETLALKWLLEAAKKRQKTSKWGFAACLTDEILEAFRKSGYARLKRDEFHRLAQQNRANSRYRWW